jgi:hypothetical protein
MELHQTKKFLHSKRNSHRLRRQPTEWEKSLCQVFIQEDSKIQNLQGTQKTQLPKNQHPNEEMNREFSKKEVQMANKYMKCSTSLATNYFKIGNIKMILSVPNIEK